MLSWRCCLYRFFRMYDLYMSFLFGGKLEAPLNPAKTVVRDVRIALRKIERDEMNAIKQEKALLSKLKALGTQRKLEACQSQAKDLVRLRQHVKVLGQMKSQLTGLSQKLAVAESTGMIQSTLARTAKLLAGLNKQLSPKEMQRVLLEFQRQNTVFTDGQEILSETLDDAFEADDESANIDTAVAQVLDEVGIDSITLNSLQTARTYSNVSFDDDDLTARLEKLRTA